MLINIGIYEVEPSFSTLVESAFEDAGTVTYLRAPEEVDTFVSDRQFPNVKILVASLQNLLSLEDLWSALKISIAVPTFHLVLLKTGESPMRLPLDVSNERVHIIDASGDSATDDLSHHLKSIKTSAEVFGLKYNVLDIFVHEEIFAEEYDFKTRFIKFIEQLGTSIQAESVQIFLLQSLVTGFLPVYEWGKMLYEFMPASALMEAFEFKNKCQTYKLSPSNLKLLTGEASPEDTPDFAVISSFTLDTVPCFVLYRFRDGQSEDLLWETCNISSWEILHLLYTHVILSRYKTLKDLTEIQQYNLERKDVLRHILDCLQKHFNAEGVSIVEYKGSVDGMHKFEKNHKHYHNYSHKIFSIDYGFAYKCVIEKKAFFIMETFYNKDPQKLGESPKNIQRAESFRDEDGKLISAIGYGDGVEFAPDYLEVDKGQRVRIPLYKTPGTVEDEASLMYYPLFQGGEIIGAIKIADFNKPNVYGLQHLRALSVFSDTIVTLLESAQALTKLKISKEQIPAKLEQLAALLTYRNLIRDIFHQVSQYLSDIGTDLLTLESLVKRKGEGSGEDIPELITNIRDYANFAMDLIDKAKKRGEDLQPVAKNCNLVADVVRPVIKYAKKKADTYKINITTTLTNRDYPVRLDPDFAQESLKNILNNAIWAVREHKGAGKKEIHIAVRESSDRSVYIEVVDSGIGIDPEIRPDVGSLFFTTRSGGSGVGVYSARRHAEHFGGSLRIEHSMPGKGTTIKIFFPLREEN